VVNKKKTFYEILAVSRNASHQEIQANHESLISRLKSQKDNFNPDEYDLKLKIINLAFDTLSSPASRAAYDAKLSSEMAAAGAPASSNALALAPDASTIALRAEAISLRAEAISLRADALSIKTAGTDFNSKMNYPGFGPANNPGPMRMIKKFMMILGGVVAAWMVIQVLFLMTPNGRTRVSADMAAKAEEKMIIQEYYQTYGVRAGSRAEVERLQAENRRQENERRTVEKAEREQERQEEAARRFERESRQRAEDVSERLHYSEDQARERAEREDAQKKYQEEEKKRRSEEAEYARIEREKERWRETLRN
jgi:curved DNA-binding protein CbpA